MSVKFSRAFKTEAVRKTLNRKPGTSIEIVADDLGIAKSNLISLG